jgi:hypothetical protein
MAGVILGCFAGELSDLVSEELIGAGGKLIPMPERSEREQRWRDRFRNAAGPLERLVNALANVAEGVRIGLPLRAERLPGAVTTRLRDFVPYLRERPDPPHAATIFERGHRNGCNGARSSAGPCHHLRIREPRS